MSSLGSQGSRKVDTKSVFARTQRRALYVTKITQHHSTNICCSLFIVFDSDRKQHIALNMYIHRWERERKRIKYMVNEHLNARSIKIP